MVFVAIESMIMEQSGVEGMPTYEGRYIVIDMLAILPQEGDEDI